MNHESRHPRAKRNWRRRLHLLSVSLSVLLLVLIAGSFLSTFGWVAPTFRWALDVRCGTLEVDHGMLDQTPPGVPPPISPWYGRLFVDRKIIEQPVLVWPFHLSPILCVDGSGRLTLRLPLYLPLLATVCVGAFPVLPPVLRRRRRRAGLCVKCSYDLTGNESGVCPECGTSTKPKKWGGGRRTQQSSVCKPKP